MRPEERVLPGRDAPADQAGGEPDELVEVEGVDVSLSGQGLVVHRAEPGRLPNPQEVRLERAHNLVHQDLRRHRDARPPRPPPRAGPRRRGDRARRAPRTRAPDAVPVGRPPPGRSTRTRRRSGRALRGARRRRPRRPRCPNPARPSRGGGPRTRWSPRRTARARGRRSTAGDDGRSSVGDRQDLVGPSSPDRHVPRARLSNRRVVGPAHDGREPDERRVPAGGLGTDHDRTVGSLSYVTHVRTPRPIRCRNRPDEPTMGDGGLAKACSDREQGLGSGDDETNRERRRGRGRPGPAG